MASPPLGQSVGYGVVIGLGFFFAFGMILTTFVLKRYNNEVITSEAFSTAGRSVKSGLVSSAVVSSWVRSCAGLHLCWTSKNANYALIDLGCNAASVNVGRLQLWRVWTLLVCLWCYCADYSLCNFGN